MNRYQEAIDALNFMADDSFALAKLYHDSKEEHKKLLKSKNVCYFALQELVDKATPKKPVRVQQLEKHDCGVRVYLNVPTCPVRNNVLYENECCRNNECRQAIDWSKDGE